MSYQYDSRKIQPGDCFLCLPGAEAFIADAKARGATEILRIGRPKMAQLAAEFYGHPSRSLIVLGVTGTNGKTTTVTLIGQILTAAGFRPKISGTLTGNLTTPESLDLQRDMRAGLDSGCTHFVMEVSSHGIDQGRVLEIDFTGKGLSNITQDHLDYHKTLEAYRAVKLKFMTEYSGWSVLPDEYQQIKLPVDYPLLGKFNHENGQLAKAMTLKLGISEAVIDRALTTAHAPKGRFEPIDTRGLGFRVVVDYAHAPDGLEQVLKTARNVMFEKKLSGKLCVVFGCGGDRDKTKRPIMGAIAARLADQIVVTSDNPRSEDPEQIIKEVLTGITDDQIPNTNDILDRREAIHYAIQNAQPGDFIVVAGKGHEDYQIIGKEKIHFDDSEEVEAALATRARLT